MSILAGRMVRMRPVVVTLCVADKLWEKTMAEIKSDFAPEEAHYLSRIQYASFFVTHHRPRLTCSLPAY